LKILLVGAGAVGQVFAYHLRAGGAEIGFHVRARYADAARKGFTLYRHGRKSATAPIAFGDFEVEDDAHGPLIEDVDQVWLCTSSQDLRQPWLDTLAKRLPNATVVAIQPDLDDRRILIERFGEARLVQGLIGFLSYQTGLPGETWPQPGVAYWLPMGLSTDFDGEAERACAVVDSLRRGGLPARVRSGIPATSALRSATTMPVVAGLEAAGWSLSDFSSGPGLRTAVAASSEALSVVDATLSTRSAGRRLALRAPLARAALSLAPRFSPFDLEAYLKFHFSKTAVQTRLLLETWIAHGERHGVATEHLVDLRGRLED
jgi:2-dehydropantoate 2-reductase